MLMIKNAKQLKIDKKKLVITQTNTLSSNMILALKFINFDYVFLIKVVHF
jgi:hypothetical protein